MRIGKDKKLYSPVKAIKKMLVCTVPSITLSSVIGNVIQNWSESIMRFNCIPEAYKLGILLGLGTYFVLFYFLLF